MGKLKILNGNEKSKKEEKSRTLGKLKPGDLFKFPNGNKVYMKLGDNSSFANDGDYIIINDTDNIYVNIYVDLSNGEVYGRWAYDSKPIIRMTGEASFQEEK